MLVFLDYKGRYYQATAARTVADMLVVIPSETLKFLLDDEPRDAVEIQEECDKEKQVPGLGKGLQVARVAKVKSGRG